MDNNIIKLNTPIDSHMNIKRLKQTIVEEDWEHVMAIGYFKGDDDFVVRSSEMSRQDALWLIEQVKKHVLGE